MADRVFIEGFAIHAAHGVGEHERRESQEFLVDMSVILDLSTAGATDDLTDTLDYGHLRDIAKRAFSGTSKYLVETLASQIAEEVLTDARILEVTVTIRKPHVYQDCVPGISIARRR